MMMKKIINQIYKARINSDCFSFYQIIISKDLVIFMKKQIIRYHLDKESSR